MSKEKSSSKDNFIHDFSPQAFYDNFNNFIFFPEQRVFNKLISKILFLQMVSTIPGSIVELGVFKGSGLAAWHKCCVALGVHRQIYGFDFFNADDLQESIGTSDKILMKELFSKRNFDPRNYVGTLEEKMDSMGASSRLISGNVMDTLPEFLNENPGFRTALVNFDLDTSEPTYFALEALWPRLVPGGIFVFDEYAINEWTESDAVDKFLKKFGLKIIRTDFFAPSAYLQKL